VSNPSKRKGTAFEVVVSNGLNEEWDDRIERRALAGIKDRGDVSNFRVGAQRVVVECKAERAIDLAGWVTEAEKEAANDGALCGIVVAKRRGKATFGDQYAIMTVSTLLKLLRAAGQDIPLPS
jgi:hypothetical protein